MHRDVGYLAGIHEDAYLAAGGDGVDLLDALKGRGEALEVAETLEIPVDGIAARQTDPYSAAADIMRRVVARMGGA